jgi:DNA-binding NtrC family response regulator
VWERHILVVDDDDIILDATATALRMAGYQVDTAEDGEEALRIVEWHRPAVIVLDLRMPRLDGCELAQHLRKRGIRIPLILMTASDDGDVWAERMGAASFLPKPFATTDLIDAVQRLGIYPARNDRSAVA